MYIHCHVSIHTISSPQEAMMLVSDAGEKSSVLALYEAIIARNYRPGYYHAGLFSTISPVYTREELGFILVITLS